MEKYFVFINILLCIYFLVFRKKVDFFLLTYISSLVYFIPGFLGVIRYRDIYTDTYLKINNETYTVFLLVQISFFLFSVLNDNFYKKPKRYIRIKEYNVMTTYRCIVLVNTIFLLLNLYQINFNIFLSRKELMSLYGTFYTLWTYSSMITFVLSWMLKGKSKTLFILSIFSILFHFYLGDRTAIMISIIGISMYEFWGKNTINIIFKNKLKVIIVLLCVIFGFMSKMVYTYIRMGEYSQAILYFFKFDNYLRSFIESEPFITQMILNHFIENKISLGSSYIQDLKYQLLLVPSNFKEYPSVSEIIQTQIFPNVHYGLAGNIWAELFSLSQYTSLVLFLVIFNLFVWILNYSFTNADNVFKAFLSVIAALTCFYIHRNFLESYLTMIRLSTLFIIFSLFISLLVSLMKTRRVKFNS